MRNFFFLFLVTIAISAYANDANSYSSFFSKYCNGNYYEGKFCKKDLDAMCGGSSPRTYSSVYGSSSYYNNCEIGYHPSACVEEFRYLGNISAELDSITIFRWNGGPGPRMMKDINDRLLISKSLQTNIDHAQNRDFALYDRNICMIEQLERTKNAAADIFGRNRQLLIDEDKHVIQRTVEDISATGNYGAPPYNMTNGLNVNFWKVLVLECGLKVTCDPLAISASTNACGNKVGRVTGELIDDDCREVWKDISGLEIYGACKSHWN